MAVGQGSVIGALSYLAIGRETTFGTYNTCTAGLDFLSAGLSTVQEKKILEQVERGRIYSKNIKMGKVVEGELSFYFSPELASHNYILQNALGGALSVATATGETIGGGALTHTYAVGNIVDQSYPSLCLNMRKGDSTAGKIFEYSGARVNELTFSAEIDDALMCNVGVICKDSSVTSNDVESALTQTAYDVLNFIDGRLSLESTFASLTASSFWHIQSMEFSLNNSLKSDSESRRIGSDTLDVLPSGIATPTLNMTVRFDTTTAYDAMIAKTQFAAEFSFQGPTISGSVARKELKLRFPKLFINNAGDPEIGGPDEILTSEIECQILHDDSSASGYALQALVTNETANYN